MAENNFPQNLYVRPINVQNVPEQMGVAVAAESFELASCRVKIYKHGTLSGSETLKMVLFADQDMTMPFASSNTINVSDFSSGSYWRGMVNFTFGGQVVVAGGSYYPALVAGNYTRNGNTFYISYAYDWPIYVNTSIDPQLRGGHMEFYKRA